MAPDYDIALPFAPVALYFHESDLVEYVREDACCVYKRIDETLTLALEMDSRLPVGFRIKGFRNLCDKILKSHGVGGEHFIQLVAVIEKITLEAGNRLFPDALRGYKAAEDIARADNVTLVLDDLAA